jgi:hypothetical protein
MVDDETMYYIFTDYSPPKPEIAPYYSFLLPHVISTPPNTPSSTSSHVHKLLQQAMEANVPVEWVAEDYAFYLPIALHQE